MEYVGIVLTLFRLFFNESFFLSKVEDASRRVEVGLYPYLGGVRGKGILVSCTTQQFLYLIPLVYALFFTFTFYPHSVKMCKSPMMTTKFRN